MTGYQQILRQAARRIFADRVLRLCGLGLFLGAAMGIATLAIDRFTEIHVPLATFGILPGIGLLAGSIVAFFTRPNRFLVAIQLDRHLKLKDRLGSIESLIRGSELLRHRDAGFMELLQRDADQLTGRVDVRGASPIRTHGIWPGVISTAMLWAGVMFLPEMNLFAKDNADVVPMQQEVIAEDSAETEKLADSIRQAVARVREDDATGPIDADSLDALDQLADQLSKNDTTKQSPESLREEAAAKLHEIADDVARRSERDLKAAEEIAKAFEGLEARDLPDAPVPYEDFLESLKRGDFGYASDMLQQVLEQTESLDDSQKRDLAESLRDISRKVEKQSESPNESLNERREQLKEALRDHALDEEAIESTVNDPPGEQSETEQHLREKGVDEETARELAEELNRISEEKEAREEQAQDKKSVSESLRRAAEQIDRQPPRNQQDQTQQSQDQQQTQSDREDSRTTQENRTTEREETGENAQREPSSQESDSQSTQQESREPSQEPGTEQRETQQGEQETQSSDSPAVEQRQTTEETAPSDEQDGEPSAQPTQELPADQMEDAVEMLRRLADREQKAEDQSKNAEQLRDLARQLADNMTPQQRDQWSKMWQQQMRDDPPDSRGNGIQDDPTVAGGDEIVPPERPMTPVSTEDVDLRGDEASRNIIARWFQEGEAPQPDGASTETQPGPVREARQVAERAVNDAIVPRRYHRSVQRFFDRLRETVRDAANSESTPAPPSPN